MWTQNPEDTVIFTTFKNVHLLTQKLNLLTRFRSTVVILQKENFLSKEESRELELEAKRRSMMVLTLDADSYPDENQASCLAGAQSFLWIDVDVADHGMFLGSRSAKKNIDRFKAAAFS